MSACDVLLPQLRERADEVGPDEARVARHLGRQLGEPLLGHRVAVDPDQHSRRADPVGDQPGVAAAAERAVHGDLTRARIEQVDQLAGEHRDVRLGHVKQCRQDSLRCRGHGSSTSSL